MIKISFKNKAEAKKYLQDFCAKLDSAAATDSSPLPLDPLHLQAYVDAKINSHKKRLLDQVGDALEKAVIQKSLHELRASLLGLRIAELKERVFAVQGGTY